MNAENSRYTEEEARFESDKIHEAMRQAGNDTYEKAHGPIDRCQESSVKAQRLLVDWFLRRYKITLRDSSGEPTTPAETVFSRDINEAKRDILNEQRLNPPTRSHYHKVEEGKITNVPVEPRNEQAA